MRIYAKKVNRLFVISKDYRIRCKRKVRIFQKTYLTDIKERYKIKNDDDLEELIDIIASSIGVDLISRYQDDDGISYMNIYEFLLNEDTL